MDTATILALVTALEQMAMGVYNVIQKAGISPDDTKAYTDRIQKALANVPDPCLGADCDPCLDCIPPK